VSGALPTDEIVLDGKQRRACATRDADLRVHVNDVMLHGPGRDPKLLSDLFVRATSRDLAQHFDLAFGESCR
jgi:hypothetical protein